MNVEKGKYGNMQIISQLSHTEYSLRERTEKMKNSVIFILGMEVHIRKLSAWRAGGSGVRGRSWLHSEFEASLGCTKPYLKLLYNDLKIEGCTQIKLR